MEGELRSLAITGSRERETRMLAWIPIVVPFLTRTIMENTSCMEGFR